MNAFQRIGTPSVVNCRPVLNAQARAQRYRVEPGCLSPRPSHITIDPNPQASADRRHAILRGGI